jgi:hypothetical protein
VTSILVRTLLCAFVLGLPAAASAAAPTQLEQLVAEFGTLFPREKAELSAQVEAANRASGDPRSGAGVAADYVLKFSSAHRSDEMAAPGEALQGVAAAKGVFFAVLHRTDVGLCAEAARHGPTTAAMNAAPEQLLAITIAEMKATRAGIDHPSREPVVLTHADDDQILAATAAQLRGVGWNSRRIETALGLTGESPPDEDVCLAQMGRYLAIALLPPQEAGRLMAGLQLRGDFP